MEEEAASEDTMDGASPDGANPDGANPDKAESGTDKARKGKAAYTGIPGMDAAGGGLEKLCFGSHKATISIAYVLWKGSWLCFLKV